MSRLYDRSLVRVRRKDDSDGSDADDPRLFLQGLLTHDLRLLSPVEPLWAALLSAQGKCLFDLILWAEGEDVLIDCEASQRDALIKRLSLYRLRRKIDIVPDTALAVHWSPPEASIGQGSRLPVSSGMEALRKPYDPRLALLGHRWLDSTDDEADAADDEWRAHRLSHGVAEGVEELGNEQTLWLECNAVELNGVSFKKGCFIGQENTARMNWRQKVNRRIVVVPIEQSDEKRQRKAYPALGLSVEHWRVSDLGDLPLPEWQVAAIGAPSHDEAGA